MAYPQFGVTLQPRSPFAVGRSGAQDPFQAALLSAQKLSEITSGRGGAFGSPGMGGAFSGGAPGPSMPGGFSGSTGRMPGGWGPSDPPPAPEPPQGTGVGGAFGPGSGGTGQLAPYVPREIAPAPPPTVGGVGAGGRELFLQTEGGRDRGDMGVQPGDPNTPQYYATKANEYNTASSRWKGTVTENDVRAFDQYAASYRQRTGKTPTVWDWLAAGRPTTKGDYYDDKAVEYNSYDTPWKGTIGRDDVVAFHSYVNEAKNAGKPVTLHITEWLNMGRPAHPRGINNPYEGWTSGTGTGVGTNSTAAPYGWVTLPSGAKLPAGPPSGAGNPNAPLTDTNTNTFLGTPPPPPDPSRNNSTATTTTNTTATATPGQPQLANFEDALRKTIGEVSARYQPGFSRDRDDLQARLMQTGAVTGALNAGGFTDVVGDEMVNLASKQSTQLGEEISKQTINATQLAMQKYVAELDDSFNRLQLRTNADLEAKAQELQKYGIDKGDLLERYKAELSLKGQTYSADRQVDAAALHAAASSAAANASAAAARYNADRDYAIGLVNADVMRENNLFDGYIKIAQLGNDWAKWILQGDPFGILTGGNVPGDVVVKP